jgi:hypothetical protein
MKNLNKKEADTLRALVDRMSGNARGAVLIAILNHLEESRVLDKILLFDLIRQDSFYFGVQEQSKP